MSESFLIKLQALRTATLLKRDSIAGFFLRIMWIIQEFIFRRLSLNGWFLNTSAPFSFHWRTSSVAPSDSFQVSGLQLYSLKETPANMFISEFCKIFMNIFRQNTSGWLYLWILRSFSDHLFYRAPLSKGINYLRNCLCHARVAVFQPPDTVKKYFTSAFQACWTRTKSSISKGLIYLKSLKIMWIS